MTNRKRSGSARKVQNWRQTLDHLIEETGISLEQVCAYIDAAYNEDGIAFYVKLPRDRRVYIGIGMAFRQPLEVINDWITRYGGKRELYIKDVSEDLVWIYLIRANCLDPSGSRNYFQSYEEYQAVAQAAFREQWDEIVLHLEDTADVEVSLGQSEYGPEYEGLSAFISEHMDAFKTAYSKPRRLLDRYVDCILAACRNHPRYSAITSLNAMRGFLDDSMINYLTGDSETIHVVDRVSGKRTIRIKHIPKGRKTHISLCLALGMTVQEINTYLELSGFGPLDPDRREEAFLINALTSWEQKYPAQRALKDRYFSENDAPALTPAEEAQAVEEMLLLRMDLSNEARRAGQPFPYITRQ